MNASELHRNKSREEKAMNGKGSTGKEQGDCKGAS